MIVSFFLFIVVIKCNCERWTVSKQVILKTMFSIYCWCLIQHFGSGGLESPIESRGEMPIGNLGDKVPEKLVIYKLY